MPPVKGRASARATTATEKDASAPASPAKVELDPSLLNQPLDAAIVERKTRALASEWANHAKDLEKVIDAYKSAATDLEETNNDEDDKEADDAIAQIDKSVREVLDKVYEVQLRADVLRALTRGREGVYLPGEKLYDTFVQRVDDGIEEYGKRTARQKFSDSEAYSSFRAEIWDVRHPGEALPSVKTWLKTEEGDDESDEDEIEIAAQTLSIKDPVTMATMRNPVKHAHCTHRIEMDSMEALFRDARRRNVACPVPGCSATWTTYEVDEPFKHRIQQMVARQARQPAAGGTQTVRAVAIDSDEE